MTAVELVQRVSSGDRRACARLITLIENRTAGALAILGQLPGSPIALRVGVTGPPGAGKSTLVDHLIRAARAAGHKVGVLAVDPSSPFSGGAILGDRVRMQEHASDPGVFIRSMGSRGHAGGLAAATVGAARVLEAYGCDVVVFETVGVGQSEVEVAQLADVTVLVLPPQSGDGIQAMKAGIMEIPDLFVVNKADLSGADALVKEIRSLLAETDPAAARDRVLATRSLATFAESGSDKLWQAISACHPSRSGGKRMARRQAIVSEALAIVADRLQSVADLDIPEGDLHVAAKQLLEQLFGLANPIGESR
ncbi:MAG: methylmalonyl Co-A mutase-associated GTPase MeaB [Cyanobacteria bacterium REEB65]|nr:methylmalonyl Co-A mutase-associated GTPase MeaB [Cyanobacteria bacterium REEB65]